MNQQNNYPILYSFVRCPYAMRARLALFCAKQIYELREVDLKNKPLELLEASPKGTVPVLVSLDNKIIEQSLEIMLWALQQNDPQGLMKLTNEQMQKAHELITENDVNFKKALDRYKYPNRYPEEQSINWKVEAERFLEKLENNLQKSSYLLGENLSFADLAIMPFIRQFSKVEENNINFLKLQNWLMNLEESEIFKTIMFKVKPWKANDERLIIG